MVRLRLGDILMFWYLFNPSSVVGGWWGGVVIHLFISNLILRIKPLRSTILFYFIFTFMLLIYTYILLFIII